MHLLLACERSCPHTGKSRDTLKQQASELKGSGIDMASTAISLSRRVIGKRWPPSRSVDSSSLLLVFAHATGFCKEVWNPVIDYLDGMFTEAGMLVRTVTFDFTGHGDSRERATYYGSSTPLWMNFCPKDILEVLSGDETAASKRVIGIGHSMGAAGIVFTELQHPGTFDALVLHEPILFPPTADGIPTNTKGKNPLSARARKRRFQWSTFEDAYASLRNRGVFKTFDDQTLRCYVNNALYHNSDTATVDLKCTPAFEAQMYEQPPVTVWNQLHSIHGETLVVVGESSTHMSGFPGYSNTVDLYRDMAKHFAPPKAAPRGNPKSTRLFVFPGNGHFAPLEKPDRFAALVFEQCVPFKPLSTHPRM